MAFKHDEGWAWVVVTASFWSCLLNGFNIYSVGIIQMALLEEFHESIAKTAVVVAVNCSLLSLASPIASGIINKSNCRTCHVLGGLLMAVGLSATFAVDSLNGVLVTYGIIAGTGMGLCYTSALVEVGYYFDRLRSLASGVAIGGSGIGMFCGPIIIRKLLETYGLKGAFLILGGINFHMCIFALLMRPSIYEKRSSQRQIERASKTFKSLLKILLKDVGQVVSKLTKNKAFMLFSLGLGFWNTSTSAILVHEPSYAVFRKITTVADAPFLITAFGIGNTISRYLVGMSTGKTGLDAMTVYMGQQAISGVLCVAFPLYSNIYLGHMIFCSGVGFYTGGLNVQYSPIIFDLVGVESYATGLSIGLFVIGMVYLCAPPLVGLIVDSGGTYEQVFIMLGIVYLLGTICTLICAAIQKNPQDSIVKHDESRCREFEVLFSDEKADQDNSGKDIFQPQLALLALSMSDLNDSRFPHSDQSRRLHESSPHINV